MDHHVAIITFLVVVVRIAVSVISVLASSLPAFDSSATLVLRDGRFASLLRWDLFYFLHIAEKGYVYENEYAFFPGSPLLMRFGSNVLESIGLSPAEKRVSLLVSGVVFAFLFNIIAAATLYELTLHHFPRSPSFAYLTVILSLLSSSPATLHHAPYTEPFFTCLSYLGMLFCAKRYFVQGALIFALAGLFRSNGIMLAGFVIWGIMIQPTYSSGKFIISKLFRQTVASALLTGVVFAPYLWHQYNAYNVFCTDSTHAFRPWCTTRPPSVYSFVQAKYWNVGLFTYWTIQQLPNILLAVPVLLLLFQASIRNIRATVPRIIEAVLFNRPIDIREGLSADSGTIDPILSPSLTPHAIHALATSVILLCAAHTQIALRMVSAMPFTYWAAASLFLRTSLKRDLSQPTHNSTLVKPSTSYSASFSWTTWSLLWGTISLVAWSVFLPPA